MNWVNEQGDKMNINIKLGKNFTTQYNKMVEKYGEEFELINGFHMILK